MVEREYAREGGKVMPFHYHKIESLRWINGSIRQDLKPDERSVWADLIALAGLTREDRRGYIERSKGIPYSKTAILTMLNISAELYDRAVRKCVNEGRLQVLPDGTLYLTNWDNYNDTSTYREKKEARKEAARKAVASKSQERMAISRLDDSVNRLNRTMERGQYNGDNDRGTAE